MPLKDLLDGLRTKSADTFERVSKAVRPVVQQAAQAAEPVVQQAGQALRGAATSVGDAAKAAWTSPLGQASRNLGGATIERAGAAMSDLERFAAEKMNAKASELRADSKPSLRSANTGANPNLRAGMSAEAEAFQKEATKRAANPIGGRAGGGGTPPTSPTTPSAAGSEGRGFFGKVGRAIGTGVRGLGGAQALAGGIEAGYTMGKNNLFGVPMPSGRSVDNMFQGAATLLHPVAGLVGNASTGIRDALLNYFIDPNNPSYSNFTPEFAAELRKRDAGKSFLGPQATAPAPVPSAATGATSPVAQAPVRTGMSAEEIIKNRGMDADDRIIPEGTGAIKIGNSPARRIGARSDAVQPGNQAPQNSNGLRIHARTPMGIIAEGLTQIKAAQARESGAAAEANLGIKSLTARTTAAKTGAELRDKAKESFAKDIDNEVMRNIDSKLPKEERDAIFAQRSADYKRRVEHTLGDTGQELVNMSGAQKQKLHVANKFREKLAGSRGELLQSLRDYAGAKRFDSENLYSYMPERVTRTATGYQIVTKNGNTMDVSSAAGGGFVLLGPNIPIDADMMAEIVAAAKRQSKGK